MYILKNALLNMTRRKGKNILIGIIITIITISSCISLTINKSGNLLVTSYKESSPLEVSFELNPMDLRQASDDDKTNFKTMDVDLVKSISDSKLLSDYFYTLEVSMSSNEIEAVDFEKLELPDNVEPKKEFKNNKMNLNIGNYRFTSYSNFSYLEDFLNGTKKIIDGEFIDNESEEKQIIISEDLSKENDLSIGDTIKFYYPTNEKKTYKFTIVGIYKDTSSIEDNSFMGLSAMNSRNQIYTNLTSINKIINDNEEAVETGYKRMTNSNGLTARFILKDEDNLNSFITEAKEKGLSNYYNTKTNENEIIASLKPIQNISDFSFVFLIVILIVGGIILAVLNIINIKDRKYEIGILRAIGMSKIKVTAQLISETFLVALISLIIGTTIGTLSSQKVTNIMLKKEVTSYQEKQNNIDDNFGGKPNFGNRPSNNTLDKVINNNTNYIDSLNVSTDLTTITKLFLVSLLLTLISGIIAVSFITKYEPNKILQDKT